MAYESNILKDVPTSVSSTDRDNLDRGFLQSSAKNILMYEEMMERYPQSEPYFMVRLAASLAAFGSGSLSIDIFRKAQSMLSEIGVVDDWLDNTIQKLGTEVDTQVNQELAKSRQLSYYQPWKPTKNHRFPTDLPYPPEESQKIKDTWQALTGQRNSFFDAYLKKLAIETNHIESTFLLAEGSVQELTRNGISEGAVRYMHDSALHDPGTIKDILNDTLAAYDLLSELVKDSGDLNKEAICLMHARLMDTCRLNGPVYIPAGKTRTEIRKTVVISGTYVVECCPFPEVDAELEVICRMAKQWIRSWRNPFATASWIHLILACCHPFQDGNGRLVRLLASIPLMQHGYPPISTTMAQRSDYYAAINQASKGDHSAFVRCLVMGMQDTIKSVQALTETKS